MKLKNVKLVISLIVLGFVMQSFQAQSQNYYCYNNWTNNAGASWWNSKTSSEYSLSEAQIKKLNSVRAENNDKIVPLQNEIMVLKRNLRNYNASLEADVKEIKADRKKIRDLEGKISDLNLDTQLKIKKILTKEQSKYFNTGGYGWWDMNDNCWNSVDEKRYSSNRMMSNHNCCR